jgi:hypothetical protein
LEIISVSRDWVFDGLFRNKQFWYQTIFGPARLASLTQTCGKTFHRAKNRARASSESGDTIYISARSRFGLWLRNELLSKTGTRLNLNDTQHLIGQLLRDVLTTVSVWIVKRMVDGRGAGGSYLVCRHQGCWGELGDTADGQLRRLGRMEAMCL